MGDQERLLLRFLARVIHAGGGVRTAAVLEIANQLGLDAGEAGQLIDDERDRESDIAVLASRIPDPSARREALAIGCMMSSGASDAERAVLMAFARGAGIPEDEAEELLGTLAGTMA